MSNKIPPFGHTNESIGYEEEGPYGHVNNISPHTRQKLNQIFDLMNRLHITFEVDEMTGDINVIDSESGDDTRVRYVDKHGNTTDQLPPM